MKKLALSIAAIVISASTFAHKDVEASLCSNTTSISINDLQNCNEVTLNNSAYKIWSYKLGFVIPQSDGTKDYTEFTGVSEKIIDSFIEKLRTVKPDKLYLEEVIVVNEKNEKFKLDPITIEVTK